MKFLCDRCKTRYSIADERVRGKILKIRCKNCSNVITVREGMPEPEVEAPAAAEARRAIRPTDYAPAVVGAAPPKPAPAPALQSAFAREMRSTQPPPSQLEEEWYVSIDGDQSGPFNLAEAQAWVKGRKYGEELFCWCEGFDDWLPTEKVSHFRGLRVKPEPPVRRGPPPPPMKYTQQVPRILEEEPRPLFAAALAALEADVSRDGGNGQRPDTTPDPAPLPDLRPKRATSSGAMALAEILPPSITRPPTLPPSITDAGSGPTVPALAKATPLTGLPARPAVETKPPPLPSLFDESETSQVGNVPLPPSRIPLTDLGAAPEPVPVNGSASAPVPSIAPPDTDDDDDVPPDDDLAIGEVSRVVRLADVAAVPRRSAQTQSAPAITARRNATAAVPSLTDASPLAQAASASLDDAPAGTLAPIAIARGTRSHTTMIAIGGLALAAVIGLVIFFVMSDDDTGGRRSSGGGGDLGDLAISQNDPRVIAKGKPADPTPDPQPVIKARGTGGGGGSSKPRGTGSSSSGTGGTGGTGTTTATGTGGKTETVFGPDGQPLTPLTADDVISKASSQTLTQRCYSRALKKDPFLDVKSIGAVLSINAEGKVTEVSLDSMASSDLGVCLQNAIKSWRFRRSTSGLDTKITLKFGQ